MWWPSNARAHRQKTDFASPRLIPENPFSLTGWAGNYSQGRWGAHNLTLNNKTDALDLSEWDFVDEFTYSEAAVLMAGQLPNLSGKITGDPSPIHRRLVDACIKGVNARDRNEPIPDSQFAQKKSSGFVNGAIDMVLNIQSTITRNELARWLKVTGFKSKYRFEKVESLSPQLEEKPLSNRERDTLLTIIAALCKEAKIPYEKPAKAAGLIQSLATGMGVSIGETTIEGHLKKIPDALTTRMK
jgi:hypothetical protein